MNTPVKFEIAKLIKEKGFDKDLNYKYVISDSGKYFWQKEGSFLDLYEHVDETSCSNHGVPDDKLISAPTIAEVVMWLYEKHGIWIKLDVISINGVIKFYSSYYKIKDGFTQLPVQLDSNFNSPTEAYETAIEYTLTKLI